MKFSRPTALLAALLVPVHFALFHFAHFQGAEPAKFVVTLTPRSPSATEQLRWSPKGAKVALSRAEGKSDVLAGSFTLGHEHAAPIRVELSRTANAIRFDVMRIDADRDGVFSDAEKQTCTPGEQRGKWWSNFQAELSIPLADSGAAPHFARAYPIDLWFVEDPQEPEAPPELRWSRRGWHEGQLDIGGKPAFVWITEMEMDGVFDQRDSWALARDRASLLKSLGRGLDGHAWLDGVAYRPIAIDPDGRTLSFEPFDPGITEAEEAAKADVYAPDRNAPRAAKPLAFGKDLAAALADAKRDKKRVLVDFETTWCGPCATMNQLVYTSAPVVDAAVNVLAVKVDGDEHRELVKRYGVSGYPTILLLDSDGTELRRAVGYRSVREMVEMLKP
jgi:thiol:disulfide interchange protein DsbD